MQENERQTLHIKVDEDADALERKYGDLASIYAENRSEAAELRGARHDAEHWREVKEEVADQGDGEA